MQWIFFHLIKVECTPIITHAWVWAASYCLSHIMSFSWRWVYTCLRNRLNFNRFLLAKYFPSTFVRPRTFNVNHWWRSVVQCLNHLCWHNYDDNAQLILRQMKRLEELNVHWQMLGFPSKKTMIALITPKHSQHCIALSHGLQFSLLSQSFCHPNTQGKKTSLLLVRGHESKTRLSLQNTETLLSLWLRDLRGNL